MSHRITKPNTEADNILHENLQEDKPKCFIMVAGAGSGKTTSLVKALDFLRKKKGTLLKKKGQKIACITYTETAENEVLQDIGSDAIFQVSTIHSFLWLVIKPYQKDISVWVSNRINSKIAKIKEDISKARTKEKTKVRGVADIAKLEEYIQKITGITKYTYSTGSDYGNGILGHDDILKMVPELIMSKKLLRTIIAAQFPYVFVDESQDTMPAVVEALLEIHKEVPDFCVGFFGDPMQKIYMHGVGEINNQDWIRIEKKENFRCPTTVLSVINNIRIKADGLQQEPGLKENTLLGSAKLFIVPADDNRSLRLDDIRQRLALEHKDDYWLDNTYEHIKVLVLVHRMAALRLGFGNIYAAINDNDASESLKNGLLDGSMWVAKPFLRLIIPLYHASKHKDDFAVISIIRSSSPAFSPQALVVQRTSITLKEIKENVTKLVSLIDEGQVNIADILKFVIDNNLLVLDERFSEYLPAFYEGLLLNDGDEGSTLASRHAIHLFFTCNIREIINYQRYVEDESPFKTQQGVKGAEFERVLTILDDEESDYNLFSYGKYFQITPLSKTDEKNINEGKDSVISRTQRLFYVSCSRATKDLAVVYFTDNPAEAYTKILDAGLFPEEDVQVVSETLASLNKYKCR